MAINRNQHLCIFDALSIDPVRGLSKLNKFLPDKEPPQEDIDQTLAFNFIKIK